MPGFSLSRRWLLVAGIGAYWLALFVMTHLPVDPDPANKSRFPVDKVVHAAAFFGLTLLLAAAVATWRPPVTWPVLVTILGVLAVYAVVDEISQGLIRYRVPDWRDWLADMLGAAAGLAVFVGASRLAKRRAAAAVSYD